MEILPGMQMRLKELGDAIMNQVDAVVVVSTMSHDWRFKPTLSLLDALGIFTKRNMFERKLVIQYDQPNAAREKILNTSIMDIRKPRRRRLGFFITLNHYLAMCDMLAAGAERALVLENDCVVHKDVQSLTDMVLDLPGDFDFINFNAARVGMDRGVPPEYRGSAEKYAKLLKDQLTAENGNRHFAKLTSVCRNANCYMVSKKFMTAMTDAIGRSISSFSVMRLVDHYWDASLFREMNMYVSRRPLFFQKYVDSGDSYSSKNPYDEQMAVHGVLPDDMLEFEEVK